MKINYNTFLQQHHEKGGNVKCTNTKLFNDLKSYLK